MANRKTPDDATPYVPAQANLARLREAAGTCTACPLHLTSMQTVFGAGPERAAASSSRRWRLTSWRPCIRPRSVARFTDELRKVAELLVDA